MKNQTNMKLFISYSRADGALLKRLETHLKPLKRDKIIDVWCDRDITAGNDWKETINENLETADIILFLISPDSLASDYCISIEMKRAMQRHEAGEAIVIPIHLRPFDEKNFGFLNLQKLPRNNPVTQWQDQDEAFVEIAK